MLQLLLFLVPLGLDTLGVSLSLGMKAINTNHPARSNFLPAWLRSALLFALAEMLMPLVGLAIGYTAALLVTEIMKFVGPILLIGIGLWELLGEVREVLEKRKRYNSDGPRQPATSEIPVPPKQGWTTQLLLALSISLDELAVGFSLGTLTARNIGAISPLLVCVLLGLQGFLMTCLGLTLGRLLHTSGKALKQWSEWLSALLLIGLGVWLLIIGD